MARAPWNRRFTAACAALAVTCALLAPPPSLAAPEKASGSPAHEIGTGGSALVGVVTSATKRSAEGTLVAPCLEAALEAPPRSAASQGRAPIGGVAPALARWRLAHGTSTSSP
jgi:hypothetical protein